MNQKLTYYIETLTAVGTQNSGGLCACAPLMKVVLLVGYLILLVSFSRYAWEGVFLFTLLPYVVAWGSGISPISLAKRVLIALPFVVCAGVANCFFDRASVEIFSGVVLSGGFLSLLVLTAKTFGAVGAVLLVSLTTSMSGITGALATLRVPCLMILQIQLMLRYLVLTMEEALHITNAYFMRNPDCKLIPMRDWGTLTGQLFIRTVRRGNAIYAAMQCRLFSARAPISEAQRPRKRDWCVTVLLLFSLACARFFL
ncbi:MAG: energy-coupling factor transporter transmembrane component T [Planctomycetia bacterium]|nr:energy-coupling factor transporter transmembrane component T [Planctomycetia bacterium]